MDWIVILLSVGCIGQRGRRLFGRDHLDAQSKSEGYVGRDSALEESPSPTERQLY